MLTEEFIFQAVKNNKSTEIDAEKSKTNGKIGIEFYITYSGSPSFERRK